MNDIADFKMLLDSLTLYSKVREDFAVQNFIKILELINSEKEIEEIIPLWAKMVERLYSKEYQGNWGKYIFDLILYDENCFTLEAVKGNIDGLNKNILNAAMNDIETLRRLSNVKCSDIKDLLYAKYPCSKDMIDFMPNFDTKSQNLTNEKIINGYKQDGAGIFAKCAAFKFTSNCTLEPVQNLDNVLLKDLKRYKREQSIVVDNTLGFLKNKPYNNVLLYGDRGTGKSSTVKAILNEYSKDGLRIIQVYKENLVHLDTLMGIISGIPLKFIIFIDDLTFSENDDNFGALKAVLEGSLAKQPENMVIYATTNRRHLVRENFTARKGDEVHLSDTIDETVSLSDRFGITVTFTLPNRDNFLEIVREIAKDRNLCVAEDLLFNGAERFALSKGNRSPRLARQFVDYLQGRIELGLEPIV